ncbi:MAG: GerMN domain-containing protein, partial [Ilumatobacter sp.]
PEGPLASLLDNLIAEGLIVETSRNSGVLTVELDEREFERIANRDEVEAIGQIVLTFLDTLRGVGQVAFTIDGDPLTVPTATGVFTDQPVSSDDYTALLADGTASGVDEPPPTTTTTTTTPSTTAPSSTVAPS